MELSFIRELYDAPGRCASVYLDATHDTEPARAAVKIRWKNLRASLSVQGADERDLRSLETELIDARTLRALESASLEEGPHAGRHGLALFASEGEVRYGEVLTSPPLADLAELSPVPRVTPMLVNRGEQMAWLRVIVDRVGADIEDQGHDAIQAEGTHLFPIRKTHGGGWSQEHLQRKAELRWQHNAKEVAEQVRRTAESIGAELVIIAGDIRGRRLLIDQLPARWVERVVEVEGGSRAPGSDLAAVDEATRVAVASAVARKRAAAIERFTVRDGEYAALGVPAVAAALDRAQVETLLLDPDAIGDGRLWVDLDQPLAAPSEEELHRWGASRVGRAHAADALVRSAAAIDADLILVSPDDVHLPGGAGAVLRYADSSTRHR
jgi:hypothetical protein